MRGSNEGEILLGFLERSTDNCREINFKKHVVQARVSAKTPNQGKGMSKPEHIDLCLGWKTREWSKVPDERQKT